MHARVRGRQHAQGAAAAAHAPALLRQHQLLHVHESRLARAAALSLVQEASPLILRQLPLQAQAPKRLQPLEAGLDVGSHRGLVTPAREEPRRQPHCAPKL
eukprot:412421-Rhodomonas_salina.1